MGGAGSVRTKSSTSISLGGPNKTHSLFVYAPGRTAGWWSPPHPTKLRPRLRLLSWASPPQQQVEATAGVSYDVSIIKLREGVDFEGVAPAAPSQGHGLRSERAGPSDEAQGIPPANSRTKLARRTLRTVSARLSLQMDSRVTTRAESSGRCGLLLMPEHLRAKYARCSLRQLSSQGPGKFARKTCAKNSPGKSLRLESYRG